MIVVASPSETPQRGARAVAPLVRHLRHAGAIIVGRTNTPEVSMRATTVKPLHGRTSGLQQTRDLFDASIYSYGINYLGLPAGVVPIDLVEELPAGVQLVGRRFREDVILDAMAAIEQRAGRLVDRLWKRV